MAIEKTNVDIGELTGRRLQIDSLRSNINSESEFHPLLNEK